MIIEEIIKNTDNKTLKTWGIKDVNKTTFKGKDGIILRVNGLRHTGNVIVTKDYNKKSITYDIYILNNLDHIKEHREKISEKELSKNLNELIERPSNWSDEFYYLQIMNKLKEYENV